MQEEQRNLDPARATENERIVERRSRSESGSDIGKEGGELMVGDTAPLQLMAGVVQVRGTEDKVACRYSAVLGASVSGWGKQEPERLQLGAETMSTCTYEYGVSQRETAARQVLPSYINSCFSTVELHLVHLLLVVLMS